MTISIDVALIDVLNELKSAVKSLEVSVKSLDDKFSREITDLKVSVAKLESLPQEIKELKEDVKELRTSGRNQIWAIISLLGVAVIGTVIREFIVTSKL